MKRKIIAAVGLVKPLRFSEGEAMDANAVITGLLSTVFKMDEAKIKEILADGKKTKDVTDAILEADRNRIKLLKEANEKEKFQEGYKKAKSEVLTALEKEVKEKYGVETDHTGLELIDHIVEAKASEGGEKGKKAKDLTEDDIKATNAYQKMEKEYRKQLNDQKIAFDNEKKELQESFDKDAVNKSVADKALAIFEGLKPVLPEDATVAQTQKNWFIKDLLGDHTYTKLDDGSFVVKDKDGKVVDDGHGNTLDFETFVKNRAGKSFVFAENNGGANAGNGNEGKEGGDKGGTGASAPGYPAGIKKPTNPNELALLTGDPNIKPAEKRIIINTYNEEKGIKTDVGDAPKV